MASYSEFLNECCGKPVLVEFKRICCPNGCEEGFLRDFTRDFLLLESFDWDTFRLNGWVILRHSDVKCHRTWNDTAAWPYPALKRRRIRPSEAPRINLQTMAHALRSAAQCSPLVSVHRERKFPDECWIGRKLRCRAGKLTCETISPMAEWEGNYSFPLKDITKAGFCDGYSLALASVAGIACPRRTGGHEAGHATPSPFSVRP